MFFALLLAVPPGLSAIAPVAAAPEPLSTADYPLGSWKTFQGDPARSGQAQTSVPPAGHIVWSYLNNSYDKPEGGAVVEGDTVYAPLGRDLTALNITTGARRWAFNASGVILSTPTIYNGTVFFGVSQYAGVPNFYAINATTGAQVWRANETPARGLAQWIVSSPVAVGGLVYYGSWTYWLYARHASNGTLAWEANLSSELRAAPVVESGVVYAATQGIHSPTSNFWDVMPQVFALDALTGSENWNASIDRGHLLATPVVSGSLLYVATAGYAYGVGPGRTEDDTGYVIALNVADGSLAWTSPDVGRIIATPALAGTTLYISAAERQSEGITGTSSRLRALNLSDTGAVLWSNAVGQQAAIQTPPVVVLNANGTAVFVAVAARDGTVGVWLASGISTPLWTYQLAQEVVAPLAVVNEMILVPCLDGRLYAFGAVPDLSVSPSDIVLSDATPHAGEPVSVQVTVRNLGDKRGSANLTVFSNESGNLTALFSARVDNLTFVSPASITFTQPWTFSTGQNITISAVLSDFTPADGNNSNDAATAAFTILANLDGWTSRFSDARNSNHFESVTPQNGLPVFNDSYGVAGSGFVAYDGTLVFAVGDVLWATASANTSAVRWTAAPSTTIVSTPVLSAGVLVVATDDSTAWFIDPDDGGVLGSTPLPAPPTGPGVATDGGVVLPCSDRLVLLSIASRTVERESATVDVAPADRPALRSAPAVAGNHAFVISSVGEFHAFDLRDGAQISGFPVALRERTDVPPTAGPGVVFVVNGSMNISVFATAAPSPVPVRTIALPSAVSGAMGNGYGRLFVNMANGNVSAMSLGTGLSVWNATIAGAPAPAGILAVANGTLFLGNRTLYALDASTGAMFWSYDFASRGAVNGSAAIHGGLLHVQTRTGSIATFGAVPGLPPVVNISSPLDGRTYRVGEVLEFSANGTFDPDAQNLTFRWTFGDGENATGAVAYHAFTGAASSITATLMVVDEQGLAASRAVSFRLVDNAAPILVALSDVVTPDYIQARLDDTLWTFTVYYNDPNGDTPQYVQLNISNETSPIKEMVARDTLPENYTGSIAFVWNGTLSSGYHNYSFSTSDGLANFSTIPAPAFPVYHLERGGTPTVNWETKYIGRGNSTWGISPPLNPPEGFSPIEVGSFALPSGALLPQYVNLSFRYNLALNPANYTEESVSVWRLDDASGQWTNVTASSSPTDDRVWANVSQPRNQWVFGAFWRPKVEPFLPVPRITFSPSKTVFEVGEAIVFSGAGSTDPNNDNATTGLSYRWIWGDLNSSNGVTVAKSYAAEGTYTVQLIVTNSFGQTNATSVVITVRSEASTSAFLGLAILIVALLMVAFAIVPVFRRRAEAPPPPRRNGSPPKPERDLGRPRAPPPGKSPGGKKGTGGLTDEESKVVDELEADFDAKSNGREK